MITSDLPDSLADDAVLEELRNTSRVLLEDVHVALFGHAVQGQCPPYEAEYGTSPDSLLRPHLLADLSAFYRAFDLEVEDRLGERSDFVGLECEFVAFLCMKQDYAASHNEHELVRQVESAHRKFLSDHLGHWVPAFAARLSSKYPKGFLASLTHLLVAMVKLDARDMGVPVGDEDLDLRLDYEPLPSCGQCPHATEEETTS